LLNKRQSQSGLFGENKIVFQLSIRVPRRTKAFSFALIFIISNAWANNEMSFCIIQESIGTETDWGTLVSRNGLNINEERAHGTRSHPAFLSVDCTRDSAPSSLLMSLTCHIERFYGTFAAVPFSADLPFAELLLFLCV
jgi:hypothetical protein